MNPWLVCGTPGTCLPEGERRLLEELGPGGIILFARNVHDWVQLGELVAALRELRSRPYVAVDMEGGRVNRLARLIGPLPSPAQAVLRPGGIVALGRAVGSACAHLGITVDYAPVVDVGRPGGYIGGEGRCLGDSPEAVVGAAEAYLAGIEEVGVAGCLKHYPGLGGGTVDSHRDLPVLEQGLVDEESVFHTLARPGRAVMVAHALAPGLSDPTSPASLSRTVLGRLDQGSCGPIISDDLEMGALARFGTLGERAAAALAAGCQQVLVCNDMAARGEVVAHVTAWAERTPELSSRLREGAARCAGFGQGPLATLSRSELASIADEARALCLVAP